jgi:proline iminopeptidase
MMLGWLMVLGVVTSVGQQSPGRAGFLPADDGARLYYRVEGSGSDTVVAIHGGPGVDLESLRADFAPLTARHTVIFYDQRGAGLSELPADTTRLFFPRQLADLDAVRRFFRLERMALVAHSYGPLLAASYALAHPDRVSRMVLLGPVPPRRGDFWRRFALNVNARLDSTQRARMAEARARLTDPKADTRQACRDYWAIAMIPRLADASALGKIRSDLCAAPPEAIRYGLSVTNRVVMGSVGDWDLRAGLEDLRVPTLVIHGEQESIPMDLVEEWVTALPDARLLRVPGAAHFAYVERPELVWPAIEEFLAGGWPTGAIRP